MTRTEPTMRHLLNAYDELDAWARDLTSLGWMVIRTYLQHGQDDFDEFLARTLEAWDLKHPETGKSGEDAAA